MSLTGDLQAGVYGGHVFHHGWGLPSIHQVRLGILCLAMDHRDPKPQPLGKGLCPGGAGGEEGLGSESKVRSGNCTHSTLTSTVHCTDTDCQYQTHTPQDEKKKSTNLSLGRAAKEKITFWQKLEIWPQLLRFYSRGSASIKTTQVTSAEGATKARARPPYPAESAGQRMEGSYEGGDGGKTQRKAFMSGHDAHSTARGHRTSSWMYCRRNGEARKLSTGMLKKPCISFWCRSMVIRWVRP